MSSAQPSASFPPEEDDSGPKAVPGIMPPTEWPLSQATWIEFERAKLDHMRRQATALGNQAIVIKDIAGQQTRLHEALVDTSGRVVERIDAVAVDLGARISAMGASVGDLAQQFGFFMATIAGESSETREKLDSLHEVDGEHDASLANAQRVAAAAQNHAAQARTTAQMVKEMAEQGHRVNELRVQQAEAEAREAKALAEVANAKATLRIAVIIAVAIGTWKAYDLLQPVLKSFGHLVQPPERRP